MTVEEFKKIYAEFQLVRNAYTLDIYKRTKKLKPSNVSKFLGKRQCYIGSCLYGDYQVSVKKLIEIAEAVEQMEALHYTHLKHMTPEQLTEYADKVLSENMDDETRRRIICDVQNVIKK